MKSHYIPQPIDTSKVILPLGLAETTELYAKNIHDVWAQKRITEGWKYGTEYSDKKKLHPCLVPYEELPESEKEYDRNSALETVKLMLISGFQIQPPEKTIKFPHDVIIDNDLEKISSLNKKVPILWASNKILPNKEIFNKVAERCFLMLDADVLRGCGAMISKSISWERTAMNLIWQLNNYSEINYLLKAPHILITFEEDGMVYINTKQRENNEKTNIINSASMILADGSCEGTQRRENPAGNSFTAMVSATALQFADVMKKVKTLQLVPILKNGTADKESEDGEDIITIPMLKDGNTEDPNSWLIANSKGDNYTHNLAVNYIKQGDKALKGKGLPFLEMGGLKTIDRFEIEGYHNIRNLIVEYANKRFSEREDVIPLSIAVFGSPGSGKSFGVKQIAKSLKECNIKTDTINVSQISSDEELGAAFQKVRDIILEDKLPLVFFDEFDSCELRWLKNFLMPMQDGKFKDASGEHPLGKCILVFAGGTASTFTDFIAPMSSADEKRQQDFKHVKGPDFVSRIKGAIDIAGPNCRNEFDTAYTLRRAMLLRSLLERDERLKKNIKEEKNFIDENILRAILYVPEYKHGARSMETVLKMSKIENGLWLPSGLPMGNQMSVHLNNRKFKDILLIKVIEQSLEGKIAQAIHTKYVEYMTDKQKKQPNVKPWENLSVEFKLSNLNQARSYREKLALIKCEQALKDESKKVVSAFSDDEILKMAKQEHQRWMDEIIENGWVYNEIRDDKKKHHDCLVEWDKLSEEVQNWDKDPVRNMIEILDSVGYGVYRKELIGG